MSRSQNSVSTQLSVMMFLELFVWGAWFVTVGTYMKAHGMEDSIYWAYTVGPLAAILSPFFLGLVADRFFATEKVLGTMHLLGAGAMFLVPRAAEWGPRAFTLVLFAHTLCFMPTLGLTNTLAFHHIQDQERQFPLIRVFGTLGWIAANFVVSKWLGADTETLQFYVAGGAGLALGLYSFRLPHTPPPARGKAVSAGEILGLGALRQLANLPFMVFLTCSLLISIPLSAYYAYANVFVEASGFENPAFNMSFGQVSEVFFMLVMPFFFRRLGVKWMLLVGMAAWAVRYLLFSMAATDSVLWMILIGILLHGICYDFFFVTGQIYTDKRAPRALRGQAQGLLVLVTQGVGMLIGAQIAGSLYNRTVGGEGTDLLASFSEFWLYPCVMATVILVVFALLFRERGVQESL